MTEIIIGLLVVVIIVSVISWIAGGGLIDTHDSIDYHLNKGKPRRGASPKEEKERGGLRFEGGAFVNEAPSPEREYKRLSDWTEPVDD